MIQQMIYRRSEQGYRTVASSAVLLGKGIARRIEGLSKSPPFDEKTHSGAVVYSRCAIDGGFAVMRTAGDPAGDRGSHIAHAWYVPPEDAKAYAQSGAIAADDFVSEYIEQSRMDRLPEVLPSELLREEIFPLGCSAAQELFGDNEELLSKFIAAVVRCGVHPSRRGFMGVCVMSDVAKVKTSTHAYHLMETLLHCYAQDQVGTVGYRSLWNKAEDNTLYPVYFTAPDLSTPESVPANYILFDLRTKTVRFPEGVKTQPDAIDSDLARALLNGNAARVREIRREALQRVAKPPVVEAKQPVVEAKPPVVKPKPPVVEPKQPVVEPKPPVVKPKPPVVKQERPAAEPEYVGSDIGTKSTRAAARNGFLNTMRQKALGMSNGERKKMVESYLKKAVRSGRSRLDCAYELLAEIAGSMTDDRSRLGMRGCAALTRCAYSIAECVLQDMVADPLDNAARGCAESMLCVDNVLEDLGKQADRFINLRKRDSWFVYMNVLNGYDSRDRMCACVESIRGIKRYGTKEILEAVRKNLQDMAYTMLEICADMPERSSKKNKVFRRAALAELYAEMKFKPQGKEYWNATVVQNRKIRRLLRKTRQAELFRDEIEDLIDEITY